MLYWILYWENESHDVTSRVLADVGRGCNRILESIRLVISSGEDPSARLRAVLVILMWANRTAVISFTWSL